MNNYAYVGHYNARNEAGVKYIKDRLVAVLGKISFSGEKETEIGHSTMALIKDIARKAFGCLPLFRTRFSENSVETFQNWYNDFAEANDMTNTLRLTGVWDDATREAFDLITNKYESVK